MKKPLLFLLVLDFLFLCGDSVYGNDFSDGLDAANRGDYNTAYKLWLPLAEKNNAESQFNLGAMYDQGKGVHPNGMRAFKWYKLSAEQGHPKALFNLGEMYRE